MFEAAVESVKIIGDSPYNRDPIVTVHRHVSAMQFAKRRKQWDGQAGDMVGFLVLLTSSHFHAKTTSYTLRAGL